MIAKIQSYAKFRSIGYLRRTCYRMDRIAVNYKFDKQKCYLLGITGLNLLMNETDMSVAFMEAAKGCFLPYLIEKRRLVRSKQEFLYPLLDTSYLSGQPQRETLETLKMYPNVQVLSFQRAVITNKTFEDIIKAGVKCSEVCLSSKNVNFLYCCSGSYEKFRYFYYGRDLLQEETLLTNYKALQEKPDPSYFFKFIEKLLNIKPWDTHYSSGVVDLHNPSDNLLAEPDVLRKFEQLSVANDCRVDVKECIDEKNEHFPEMTFYSVEIEKRIKIEGSE